MGVEPVRTFTVASLASAWECSESLVRKLVASGRLGSFKLGTLIRIPADEVKRFECQNIASNDSGADMPASGETLKGSATGQLYPPPIGSGPKQRRASGGDSATVLSGPWER